jgi:predicted ribosome quality control (RQC) complex YloA/Tae2 family protein
MYIDAFAVSAFVDEFMDTIVGGRVQDVIDVDQTGIGMEIYANRRRQYLYLSADKQIPRLHVSDEKLRRGRIQPTQIGLLMRRYVEGGVLMHVSQPPYERILHFHFNGPEGEVEVIIEPMERRSNLLLVQNGVILDCMRRVGPEDNRYRLSLPAHEYVPPPPITGKQDPAAVTAGDVREFFAQNEDDKRKAYQVLTGNILGVSPLLAREVVFRAGGVANQKAPEVDAEAIYAALETMIAPLTRREWQPGIAENDEAGAQAFSVFPLTYIDGWHPVETVSEAVMGYFGAPVGEDAYKAAKKPVQAAIEEGRTKNRAKLRSLQTSHKDDSEREYLRQSGELILAYQYTLEKGQTELKAQYDPAGPELTIKLDPQLSPLDNAQRYFTKYNKAKRALEDVPRLIRQTKNELDWLDQLEIDLEMASNWPDIDEVRQALQSAGYWKGKAARRIAGGGQSAPMRLVTGDGFLVWVGRNSRQNEIVTFKKANGEDYWLHARDVPGAHVIIKFDGRTITDTLIEGAAAVAAYYSKLRGETKAPVDVTRVKYVKKIKGAGQGMVSYRNERTLLVEPQDESLIEE